MTLIEKIQKLTGPDRQIDLEISVAVNYREEFRGPGEWRWSIFADEVRSSTNGALDPTQFVPRWTGQIEHALMLIPDGAIFYLGNGVNAALEEKIPDGRPWAHVDYGETARAATLPIAVCIAALTHLEKLKGEKNENV